MISETAVSTFVRAPFSVQVFRHSRCRCVFLLDERWWGDDGSSKPEKTDTTAWLFSATAMYGVTRPLHASDAQPGKLPIGSSPQLAGWRPAYTYGHTAIRTEASFSRWLRLAHPPRPPGLLITYSREKKKRCPQFSDCYVYLSFVRLPFTWYFGCTKVGNHTQKRC